MANILLMRQFQINCMKNVLNNMKIIGLAQPKGVAFQTMASAPILSNWNLTNNKHICITQKSNLSMSDIKKSSEVDYKNHDHVKHWTAEKILTVAMLGTVPAAILYPSSSIEYLLALQLSLHVHWGIEAVVVDYIRPSLFGKTIPKLSIYAVYGLSALTFGGLCYFIFTDVGLVNAVKLLWKL